MADVTWAASKPNKVLTNVAVVTAEKSIEIAIATGASRQRTISMKCDQDWFYMSASGGDTYLVKANEVFKVRVQSDGDVFYVKRSTADGTLYAVVAE